MSENLKTVYTPMKIYETTVLENLEEQSAKQFSDLLDNQRKHEIIVAAIGSGKSARKALEIANTIMAVS